MGVMRAMLRAAVVAMGLLGGLARAEEPITIRMMGGVGYGIPAKEATDSRSLARRAVFEEFQRQNPDVRVVNAGGLEFTAGQFIESMFLMSMAGSTAPDVFYVNFRQYYNYIDQGFCRPLNDLIAADPSSVDRVSPVIMNVLKSYDGNVYAVPWFQVAQGLYYRKDHFIEAGLDPSKPPKDWDEFYRYAQRLTESEPGRVGFAFSYGPGYHWSNFVWQAGGEIVEPGEGGLWKASIATPQVATALDFYRKLTIDTWQKDGKTYGPAANASPTWADDVRLGKVSMWFSYTNDVVLNTSDLNPALLQVARMPAGPAGHANEINAGMWAINASIKDPAKIDACWRFIKFFAGQEAARINTERFVEFGLGNLVNPSMLRQFGYEDLVRQVDPAYVEANEDLFRTGHPEPYGRNCQQVYTVLDNALERARLDPNRPALDILKEAAAEMDEKLLGYTPPEIMAQRRGWAAGIAICLSLFVGSLLAYTIRKARLNRVEVVERLPAGTNRRAMWRFLAVCLAPAALTIAVWHYYPLAKGLQIAFQDYRITQGTRWVGLDNFIAVFTQPVFYKSLLNSFAYVALTIVIGFLAPIFLALSLNEIPRFKVFFRTVFYLPAMTSGVVIAFLWRQFYDKAETGLLNSLLLPITQTLNPLVTAMGFSEIPRAHNWLGDPTLAMFAVVLPGIWAGAGPGSILYLAALKNIPEERYEAADMDGASWISKIRHIVFPGLKPLILINLLGVFIAGFKAMESVFILTGGGPVYATHTIGLEVWTNAFMLLKFGYATAAAWVMGTILIGFTLIQIRSLLRMRFSTARN